MKKKITIKARIILWYSVSIFILVALMFLLIAVISNSVLYGNTKSSLMELVNSNANEIEYYSPDSGASHDPKDQYIEYKNGHLELDDDFCSSFNGIYVTLYDSNHTLLYGEIPERDISAVPFQNNSIQSKKTAQDEYFLYDIALEGESLEGLWLRGSASKKVDFVTTLTSLALALFPIIALIAIVGGYFIARQALKPIKEITCAADEISEGKDLSKRLPVQGGNEMQHLASSFNSMFDRLDKSFESERRFTSDASHEMRTPVSVILAQCEYALEDENEEVKTQALESIQRQGYRLSKLISRLLDFTRLEQGTRRINMDILDLSSFTGEICNEQQFLTQAMGTQLSYNIEEKINVKADRELLSILIMNLIGNAIKYGKENGKVHVELKKERGNILLSVSDDGIGISEENLEKIFNRFFRVDSSRSTEGTGLGLSMVKQIALLHRGDITVKSELGKGSTFTFSMPENI